MKQVLESRILVDYIVSQSHLASKQVVSINCSSIPENLFESELFGYESGSFTGASKNGKMGLFEAAEDGVIFLDEINSMPLSHAGKIAESVGNKTVLSNWFIEGENTEVQIYCSNEC